MEQLTSWLRYSEILRKPLKLRQDQDLMCVGQLQAFF